jgi:orotidine-5'-phosphate decarboxylase
LIFALDVSTLDDAVGFARELRGHIGVFKIGLELFLSCGPEVVRTIKYYGKVFLDLKLFDIPNTVMRAAMAAANLNVDYLTVANLNAVAEASKVAPKVGILAVPCLTSDVVPESDIENHGLVLGCKAIQARGDGACGLVCAGTEVARLKHDVDGLIFVVPGIRMPDDSVNDQVKVSTPDEAIANGADMIVVGRSIREAFHPWEAADKIVELIAKGLEERKQ